MRADKKPPDVYGRHTRVWYTSKTEYDNEGEVSQRFMIRAVIVKRCGCTYLIRLSNGEERLVHNSLLSYTSNSRKNANRRRSVKRAKVANEMKLIWIEPYCSNESNDSSLSHCLFV